MSLLAAAITWDYSSLLRSTWTHTPLFQWHCVGLSHAGTSGQNITVLRRQMFHPRWRQEVDKSWVMMSYRRFSSVLSVIGKKQLVVVRWRIIIMFVGIASSSRVQTVSCISVSVKEKGKKTHIKGSSSGGSAAGSLQYVWRIPLTIIVWTVARHSEPEKQKRSDVFYVYSYTFLHFH